MKYKKSTDRCINYYASRHQFVTEKKQESKKHLEGYIDSGCYSCNGYDIYCINYNNTNTDTIKQIYKKHNIEEKIKNINIEMCLDI